MKKACDSSSVWFEKAEEDLLGIHNNIASKNVPWGLVAFLAQQVAEKYLKGFIAAHQPTIQRTHDLVTLLKLCSAYVSAFESYEPQCRILSALYLVSRYPDMTSVTETEARSSVDTALQIKKLVLDSLSLS